VSGNTFTARGKGRRDGAGDVPGESGSMARIGWVDLGRWRRGWNDAKCGRVGLFGMEKNTMIWRSILTVTHAFHFPAYPKLILLKISPQLFVVCTWTDV
jgi:hypothetical protein